MAGDPGRAHPAAVAQPFVQTGRRLTLAVASATLALAGALLAPASATATVPQAGAEATQDVGPAGEIPQPQTAGPVELDTKQSCDTLQEQLDGYAEQGVETVTCLDQLASSPTGGQAAAPLKAADTPEEPAGAPLNAAPKCSVAMGQWYFTRFDACGSLQLTYDVFDTRTKKKIGGATFTAKQEIILQAKSGAWKTDDSVKLDSAWGAAKGLRAAWKTECLSGSACGASSAWSGAQAIGVGKTLYGGTSYTWKAGQSTEGFHTKTTVTITGAGQILLYPASFQPPGKMPRFPAMRAPSAPRSHPRCWTAPVRRPRNRTRRPMPHPRTSSSPCLTIRIRSLHPQPEECKSPKGWLPGAPRAHGPSGHVRAPGSRPRVPHRSRPMG